MGMAKRHHGTEFEQEFETGFDVGQTVTFGGKSGVVRQVVIERGKDGAVLLLVDFGAGDERQVPAAAVS